MDIMKVLKNYISQGLSPEAIVTKMAGNNPMFKNLIQMQKNGDTKGVETFARNFCKERNIDLDKEYEKMKNLIK